jgi:hypothetical protein
VTKTLLRISAAIFALAVALVCIAHSDHAAPQVFAPGLAIGMVARRKDADAAIDLTAEQKKAAGQTDSQQALREYHETTFQTTDPVTGEARDLDAPLRVARVDRGETVDGPDEAA